MDNLLDLTKIIIYNQRNEVINMIVGETIPYPHKSEDQKKKGDLPITPKTMDLINGKYQKGRKINENVDLVDTEGLDFEHKKESTYGDKHKYLSPDAVGIGSYNKQKVLRRIRNVE